MNSMILDEECQHPANKLLSDESKKVIKCTQCGKDIRIRTIRSKKDERQRKT
ncbi:MAG: hypothetical protein JSW06_02990 [Thermoplasmatales archaeon]|nr:MAG: hypothetical protein JSW06_02990 [Thermoplasmatales archaeon]